MKIKDVVLEKSNWKQTRQSLSHVSDAGNSSNVYSTYAAAYNQPSPYYNSSSSYENYYALSGFAKDIDEIVEISKSIRDLIDSQDEDGVCHYSYNDEVSVARNVQGKLDTLMRYVCQAEKEIENQIDHKFYEEIDKVFYNLEQLQIQNYKTKNIIGYQRKETITDEYGQTVEYMVTPEDVSITDLYSVDNIYSEQLKDEYKEYKTYYPDIEISESDYLVSTLNSRYFNYDSLYEQQIHVENIRDWLLLGVTIITGIVCPPAAFAIGFGFGVLEVGSVIAGRDYLTGRKMETGERIQRGIFGALDMLPGVVVIAKQFEYGRKILNTVGKLKAKALNFVKDTYDIGKSKLTSAYNSLIRKIDNFENSIIRQIDDAFVGNSRLRPAFAGIPNNNFDDVISNSNKAVKFSNQAFSKADDVVKGVDDVVEINRKTVTKLYSVEEFKEKINKLPHPEISNDQFEKVLKTTKGNRPDPIYLYKQSDIDAHLKLFENGVVRIESEENLRNILRKYNQYGHPEGCFVLPKDIAEEAIKTSNGNVEVLEELLGLKKGTLGKNPQLVEITKPDGLRMASGNEFTANDFWRPGGFTSGGLPEVVINSVDKEYVTNKSIFKLIK